MTWCNTISSVRFAKIVFRVAAIWGVLVITPLYFMFDLISRNDPPPITHPGFFYGFAGVCVGLGSRVFLHRQRSCALSPAHDSFHYREIQLRCRGGNFGSAAAHAQLGHALRWHGLASGSLVRRRVLQDASRFLRPPAGHRLKWSS